MTNFPSISYLEVKIFLSLYIRKPVKGTTFISGRASSYILAITGSVPFPPGMVKTFSHWPTNKAFLNLCSDLFFDSFTYVPLMQSLNGPVALLPHILIFFTFSSWRPLQPENEKGIKILLLSGTFNLSSAPIPIPVSSEKGSGTQF